MNQNSYAAVTAMLNAFPQSAADIRALLLTYDRALSDVSDEAINQAAMRFVSGDVPEQSKKFVPSVAEFVEEARRQEDVIEIRARPRLPAPSYRPGPLAPFEIARQKSLSEHSHLPVLFENIGFDDWKKLSKQQQIPPGSVWVAATETVYGPPKHQQAKAA